MVVNHSRDEGSQLGYSQQWSKKHPVFEISISYICIVSDIDLNITRRFAYAIPAGNACNKLRIGREFFVVLANA